MEEGRTQSATTMKAFNLFPYLNDDLKATVLSYVAEALLETMKEGYPQSPLTHTLPTVSKKFSALANSNMYWKDAIERQVAKEPRLWKTALFDLSGQSVDSSDDATESASELVKRSYSLSGENSYKSMYKTIVSNHLRFVGPVFCKGGHVQLGQPYSIDLREREHLQLIAHVLKDHSEEAFQGGQVHEDATFIHANRGPLEPTMPAMLVRVLRCETLPDGEFNVLVMPFAHVWLERFWFDSGRKNLLFAQSLKMGQDMANDMNRLSRQEALVHVMDLLARQFDDVDDGDHLENDLEEDDDGDDDEDLDRSDDSGDEGTEAE